MSISKGHSIFNAVHYGSADSGSSTSGSGSLAALCQIVCLDGDRQGNFVRIENGLKDAKKADARLACFPETAILGWINPAAHKTGSSHSG